MEEIGIVNAMARTAAYVEMDNDMYKRHTMKSLSIFLKMFEGQRHLPEWSNLIIMHHIISRDNWRDWIRELGEKYELGYTSVYLEKYVLLEHDPYDGESTLNFLRKTNILKEFIVTDVLAHAGFDKSHINRAKATRVAYKIREHLKNHISENAMEVYDDFILITKS
jgi:hypothetical protein